MEASGFFPSLQTQTDVGTVNRLRVIETAKKYLGYGYSKSRLEKVNQVLDEFPDHYIINESEQSFYQLDIYATEDEAREVLDNNFKAHIGAPLKGEYKSRKFIPSGTTNIFCAVTCLKIDRCVLKKPPFLQPDVKISDPLSGDGFIRSGNAYVGYELLIRIGISEKKDSSTSSISGGVGVSLWSGLINLGISGERLKEDFEGRTVTEISISSLVHGGYTLSDTTGCRTLDQLMVCIEKIRVNFFEHYHPSSRQFYVNHEKDLQPYSINQYPLLLAKMEHLPEIEDPLPGSLPTLPYVNTETYFNELGRKMKKLCPPTLIASLGELKVEKMLIATHKAFNSTFDVLEVRSGTRFTAVIGPTGNGKSLLIGYLLGEKVVPRELKDGSTRLDFASRDSSKPIVGHNIESETKGAKAYANVVEEDSIEEDSIGYLDTAGLWDTKGSAADVCNATACKLLAGLYPPEKIIVVIPSAYFTDLRNINFMNLVDSLGKIIGKSLDGDTLQSVMFLFSDRYKVYDGTTGKPIDENSIKDNIAITLKQLKSQGVKLLEGEGVIEPGLFDSVKAFVAKTLGAEGSPKPIQLDQQVESQLEELERKIDILESIEKNSRFLFANFKSEKMREEILTWQKTPSQNSLRGHIGLENLVPYGFSKFKMFLSIFVSYFNRRYSDLMQLETSCELLKRKMNDNIKLINGYISGNELDILQMALQVEKNHKAALEAEVPNRKIEIAAKKGEIWKLENDNTLVKLIDCFPNEPISPRPFISRGHPRTYKFEYRGVKISHARPNRTKLFLGGFSDFDSGLKDGQYYWSSVFTPEWFFNEKDINARVALFAYNKDLPSTQVLIETKKTELRSLESIFGEISGCGTQITKLEGDIVACSKAQKEDKERFIANLKAANVSLMKQLQENTTSRHAIRSELIHYQPLVNLFVRIIRGYKLHQSESDTEEELFSSFVRDFGSISSWKTFSFTTPIKQPKQEIDEDAMDLDEPPPPPPSRGKKTKHDGTLDEQELKTKKSKSE